ncbi:hypothetical protein HZA85_00780 [Candidatus Uhrbacteria bacterium]|nr:hypothetical protein [Candidatus Uhrbacteria bacterium]
MKHFLTGLLIATSAFLLPLSAFAAGDAALTFLQTQVSARAGESFDLIVTYDAAQQSVDTVRAMVKFDPVVLKAKSVVLVGAFNHSAPGNVIDNSTGKISWGAFTLDGRVEKNGSFAKVTFEAKQEGKTNVSLDADSKIISGGEEKIDLKKLGTVAVKIAGAEPEDPTLSVVEVTSASHPEEEKWYPGRSVGISWTGKNGESALTSYLYGFDENSSTNPTTPVPANKTTLSFADVKDGIHYFHIKGVQKDGKMTKTVHRAVQVDGIKPNGIALTIAEDQIIEGESLWMTFATTDETSGVVQYQVAINNSEFKTQISPLELTDLKAGTYFVRIAAFDRAGNVIYQGQSVRVYPPGTELKRPEGYDAKAEIEAVTKQPEAAKSLSSKNRNLLITLVLVVVAAFGIIYASKKKKIK